jgi:hypothetical protein
LCGRDWNEASKGIEIWPKTALASISFKAAFKRRQWGELTESFRRDAEAYLATRASPDLFDERPDAPRGPLAASTLRVQREHLRLAASVLIEGGIAVEDIRCLADLLDVERFKLVLRHYNGRANGEPNAFVISLSITLIQVAQFYLGATTDRISELKRIAVKLPSVPLDLTSSRAWAPRRARRPYPSFTETVERRLGVHLTPHQLRHLAAIWYLEEHPEDFETLRALLGHAWSKTTCVYAGSSTRRASKAYSRFVIEKRDALKLKLKGSLKRKSKKGSL